MKYQTISQNGQPIQVQRIQPVQSVQQAQRQNLQYSQGIHFSEKLVLYDC